MILEREGLDHDERSENQFDNMSCEASVSQDMLSNSFSLRSSCSKPSRSRIDCLVQLV
jgi:hypothetical protein